MGQCKERQIEIEQAYSKGYIYPKHNHKAVCAKHFSNQYLAKYINKNGYAGICSYCGHHTTVLNMTDFMDYVGNRLVDYLGPMDNEDLYLANSFMDKDEEEIPGFVKRGPYIVPFDTEYYEDVYDLVNDYGLVTTDDSLNEDIASCFNVDYWIRRDPTALLMKDELLFSWQNFASLVKNKLRYTFFRHDEYYQDANNSPYKETDILAEVATMVKLLEENIPAGEKLYRGRPEDDKAPFSKFSELTSTPVCAAKSNRMSPHGISMFYGSFESNTPVKEIFNYLKDKSTHIYLGEFMTKRDLKVINLCNIPSPNFWMEDKDDWQRYAFLHSFHEEISKPIGSNDEELEYIPSQVFSEYLRFIQKSKDGSPYDGIVYRSSLTEKKNVVLFYDNKSSEKILELLVIKKNA